MIIDGYKIIQGNALDVLRSMESESVQVSVCSPPYYGLRSYKTEPQIWDGDENCDHVWGSERIKTSQASRDVSGGLGGGRDKGTRGEQGYAAAMGVTASQGSFCQKCRSWRGELGLEPTFQLYISHLIQIFREVKRVLKSDGCCFVNLGDSYAGSGKGIGDKNGHGKAVFTDDDIVKTDWSQITVRAKSLMNIPHRFFIGMTDELQMIQRNNINWWKRACMPSSATDRWTVDFESIGFFTKRAKYTFNQDIEPFQSSASEIARQYSSGFKVTEYATNKQYSGGVGYGDEGRNARTTWDIAFEPSGDAHYASYPTKLVEKMILASSNEGDVVLDIFNGTASTGIAALRNRRKYLGIELQPEYIEISNRRLSEVQVKLF